MVIINEIANEDELYEFEIIHGKINFKVGCELYHFSDFLLLMGVDVEGPGQNPLGSKVHVLINDVAKGFCNQYKVNRILILGAKRTIGKTTGTFFRPIYKKYD